MIIIIDVDKGIIRDRNYPFCRIAAYITESTHLLHIDVGEACQLCKHTSGGIIHALTFLNESPHEGALALGRLEVSFQEEKAELPLLETEDDAVNRQIELRICTVESHLLPENCVKNENDQADCKGTPCISLACTEELKVEEYSLRIHLLVVSV